MKEETLEEAAKNYIHKPQNNDYGDYNSFIEGAKWQQEKTIEEVFEWLTTNNYLTDLKETMIKDFNKFKNK